MSRVAIKLSAQRTPGLQARGECADRQSAIHRAPIPRILTEEQTGNTLKMHVTVDSMHLNRANVYPAEPDAVQHAALVRWVGACRYVYNLGLEQRRDFGRGRRLNYVSQARELTELRAEVDWLKAAPVHALQNALRAVEHAFQRFFAGLGG